MEQVEQYPKQWIILRKDLNMRKGKMVSQGAHASMKVLLKTLYKDGDQKMQVMWWPQLGAPEFVVPVKTPYEAKLIMNTLANYDLFQFHNKIKGDYCNAGSFQVLETLDEGQEWCDWYDNNGDSVDDSELIIDEATKQWLDGAFAKIVLYVDSEEELVAIYEKAKEANIQCAMIEDNGVTEFNGVKTKTAVAIGPAFPNQVKDIVSHLKLL